MVLKNKMLYLVLMFIIMAILVSILGFLEGNFLENFDNSLEYLDNLDERDLNAMNIYKTNYYYKNRDDTITPLDNMGRDKLHEIGVDVNDDKYYVYKKSNNRENNNTPVKVAGGQDSHIYYKHGGTGTNFVANHAHPGKGHNGGNHYHEKDSYAPVSNTRE